ncbi:hypothetical protein [Enterococcus sp. LJL90]
MFDFGPFRDSFFGQILILLTIVGVVSMLVALATESWGKSVGVGVGIVVIAVIILALKNIQPIAEWFKNLVFNQGTTGLSIRQTVAALTIFLRC